MRMAIYTLDAQWGFDLRDFCSIVHAYLLHCTLVWSCPVL